MRTLATVLLLVGCMYAQAQKKNFPETCPDLKQKLIQIKQSFTDLSKFKKGTQNDDGIYASSISFCGAPGSLEVGEDYAKLSFEYSYDTYTVSKEKEKTIEMFVKNFRQAVKAVFGNTYEETEETDDDEYWGKSKTFNYSPYASFYPRISITFPYADSFVQIQFKNGE